MSLLSPIDLGILQIRNRIVFPPITTRTANENGEASPQLIKRYAILAENVGIIIVEQAFVSQDGRSLQRQLDISSDKNIPSMKKLTDAIHEKGSKAILQLNHAGRFTTSKVTGQQIIAPSPIPKKKDAETPRKATLEDIERIGNAFAEAAIRSIKAGFDSVEIHCAHFFLNSQFLSPLSNQRNDEYGGSIENRMRFPIEVAKRVVDAVPNVPVFCRLGVTDMLDGGLELEDGLKVAKQLEEVGIAVIDVSAGLGGIQPPNLKDRIQGFFIPYATAVKNVVQIPVIGVGGIKDPVFADTLVKQGKTDFVAIGRALNSNPNWAKDAYSVLTTS